MGLEFINDLATNDLIYVKRIPYGKIVIVYTVRHTVNNAINNSFERETWWNDPLGVTI